MPVYWIEDASAASCCLVHRRWGGWGEFLIIPESLVSAVPMSLTDQAVNLGRLRFSCPSGSRFKILDKAFTAVPSTTITDPVSIVSEYATSLVRPSTKDMVALVSGTSAEMMAHSTVPSFIVVISIRRIATPARAGPMITVRASMIDALSPPSVPSAASIVWPSDTAAPR